VRVSSSSSSSSSSSASSPSPPPPTTAAQTQTPVSAPARPTKRVTIHTLRALKAEGTPITMVTAYDFPSAVHVDVADIDVLLCGDSVGMVELGLDTTMPVTLDDMVHHCRAVSRGCSRPLLVGDLPFGTYEADPAEAFRSAARILKQGGMDAVKLEGGVARVPSVKAVVQGGIAAMGHVGLTPQAFSAMGGFRYQGRNADQAVRITRDALAVQDAGVFAVVVECVPPVVAREITKRLEVPTIGIGSGPHCDGQVLVYHDVLGFLQHPWHAAHALKFCKQYAAVGMLINQGLAAYRDDVRNRVFPGKEHSPYTIPEAEAHRFLERLETEVDAERRAVGSVPSEAAAAATAATDDSTKLYAGGAQTAAGKR